jgi:hypothetical protein
VGLDEEVLRRTLLDSDLDGKEWVMERLTQIHRRYVLEIDAP